MSTTEITVWYGRDADTYLVARDANRALEGHDCRVQVGDGEIYIYRKGQPDTEAVVFSPGQRLLVEVSGAWRIEPAETAERAA